MLRPAAPARAEYRRHRHRVSRIFNFLLDAETMSRPRPTVSCGRRHALYGTVPKGAPPHCVRASIRAREGPGFLSDADVAPRVSAPARAAAAPAEIAAGRFFRAEKILPGVGPRQRRTSKTQACGATPRNQYAQRQSPSRPPEYFAGARRGGTPLATTVKHVCRDGPYVRPALECGSPEKRKDHQWLRPRRLPRPVTSRRIT